MGVGRLPPTSFFLASAVFHYLGPSLAVLLFAHVAVLGVAWLRIVSAAVVFGLWRRPWRILRPATHSQRLVFLGLGVILACMNSLFYLAVDRLPLSTVGAIEFLGTVVLVAVGARTRRNVLALLIAVAGVAILTEVRLSGQPLGFVFAFANCVGFMLYVVLGHRIANTAANGTTEISSPMSGIDQLGLSMLIAAVVATPIGLVPAAVAFTHPLWLAWGIGVGVCSSVIPYVTDQLAMARLPRATFALMLALLPAAATAIGLVVLGQTPTLKDLAGIGLVIAGVALHRDAHDHALRTHTRRSPAAEPATVSGDYDRQLLQARRAHRRRRDRLVSTISSRLPELELGGAAAGMQLLLKLPPHVDDFELATEAAQHGINISALSPLHLTPAPDRGLLLRYGRLQEPTIEQSSSSRGSLSQSSRPDARVRESNDRRSCLRPAASDSRLAAQEVRRKTPLPAIESARARGCDRPRARSAPRWLYRPWVGLP